MVFPVLYGTMTRPYYALTIVQQRSKNLGKARIPRSELLAQHFVWRTHGKKSAAAMPVDLAVYRLIQLVGEPMRVSSSALAGPGGLQRRRPLSRAHVIE
jgi:hypothetical protein